MKKIKVWLIASLIDDEKLVNGIETNHFEIKGFLNESQFENFLAHVKLFANQCQKENDTK